MKTYKIVSCRLAKKQQIKKGKVPEIIADSWGSLD